jgi:hypothetical protein
LNFFAEFASIFATFIDLECFCVEFGAIVYIFDELETVTVVTVVAVIVCYGGESWRRERKMILLLMSWQ